MQKLSEIYTKSAWNLSVQNAQNVVVAKSVCFRIMSDATNHSQCHVYFASLTLDHMSPIHLSKISLPRPSNLITNKKMVQLTSTLNSRKNSLTLHINNRRVGCTRRSYAVIQPWINVTICVNHIRGQLIDVGKLRLKFGNCVEEVDRIVSETIKKLAERFIISSIIFVLFTQDVSA